MNKNYIIWGLTERSGFKECISSSYSETIIIKNFKESISDKIEPIAFNFTNKNNIDYFFSIESHDNSVLYTIYRVNFYNGSRRGYDAATLILDSNSNVENISSILINLIDSYVTQKSNPGVSVFNFENILSQIQAEPSSFIRDVSSEFKQGYIKYSNSELNSSFINRFEKIFDFNKVFFFPDQSFPQKLLEYLENKSNNFKNLLEIKKISISVKNFYHEDKFYAGDRLIQVEDGDRISVYEGQKIIIHRNGKEIHNKTAKFGQPIKLNKVSPKHSNSTNEIPNKKYDRESILLVICFFLFISTLTIAIFPQPTINFFKKIFVKSENSNTQPTVSVKCAIIFDGVFSREGKKMTSYLELDHCFQEEYIYITDFEKFYKLTGNKDKIKSSKDNKEYLEIDNPELRKILKKFKDNQNFPELNINKLIKSIDLIINFNDLKKDGLKGPTNLWKINDNFEILRKANNNINFKKINGLIDKHNGLKPFLKEKLPPYIYDKILNANTSKGSTISSESIIQSNNNSNSLGSESNNTTDKRSNIPVTSPNETIENSNSKTTVCSTILIEKYKSKFQRNTWNKWAENKIKILDALIYQAKDKNADRPKIKEDIKVIIKDYNNLEDQLFLCNKNNSCLKCKKIIEEKSIQVLFGIIKSEDLKKLLDQKN